MSGARDDFSQDREPRELVPDEWRAFDDTLAEGPAPAEVPVEAHRWLAEQRFMHGMLRALHTADPVAREHRVERVLDGLDAAQAAGSRRHWGVVAVAAMLLATLALWFALPDRLPTAEAAVGRIVAEMEREVDRRYRVAIRTSRQGEKLGNHVFSLVTRPGSRFQIDGRFSFRGQKVASLRIGSDGEEVWVLPANRRLRQAVPLRERGKLRETLDDVLDLVELDVHELINKLPEQFEVQVVGREKDRNGRELLRIEAKRRRGSRGPRAMGGRGPAGRGSAGRGTAARAFGLRGMWLLCDEETGRVHHLGIRSGAPRGPQRTVRLDYLGEEPSGLVDYTKPW
ncbi:MAG: hypothetical protein NXI31_06970 [bacterium]|nr:hypothetical protein [bacterium]